MQDFQVEINGKSVMRMSENVKYNFTKGNITHKIMILFFELNRICTSTATRIEI